LRTVALYEKNTWNPGRTVQVQNTRFIGLWSGYEDELIYIFSKFVKRSCHQWINLVTPSFYEIYDNKWWYKNAVEIWSCIPMAPFSNNLQKTFDKPSYILNVQAYFLHFLQYLWDLWQEVMIQIRFEVTFSEDDCVHRLPVNTWSRRFL
jgi:hypothetical protein